LNNLSRRSAHRHPRNPDGKRTRTIARKANEARWIRLIGLLVDTLWAVSRLDSVMSKDGSRERLGGGARLLLIDDVLRREDV
jgi:hypothetical protein